MAPEVLLRQNHSFCADFYAVGVIAYELLVSKRPYVGRDRKSIREEMLGREAKVPTNFTGRISKEGTDFINRVGIRIFSCCKGQPVRG
jgi:serine/threonine protein kinase